MRIFLVDDSKSVLASLLRALTNLGCEVLSFTDPREALNCLLLEPPNIVVVDYIMPQMNGIEFVRHIRHEPSTIHIPIIMLTSQTEKEIRLQAMTAGVTEFLNKPVDEFELNIRIRNFLDIARERAAIAQFAAEFEKEYRNAARDLEKREEEIIWRLSKAIGCRDGETGFHVDRVASMAKMMAEDIGLGGARARMIFLATPLHDVGKIGIADSILRKPGKLTTEERAEMCKHTLVGSEILGGSNSELIRVAEKIAVSHHEKWDGSGYPYGLKKTAIPIEARIVAIADVVDALCSQRPYKAPWPLSKVYQEILAGSGTHFDPDCVASFVRLWPVFATAYAEPGPAALN